MSSSAPSLPSIFDAHIHTLALTLRPNTIHGYQATARNFLAYLRTTHPDLSQLSDLRRDPHLLGWFRFLCDRRPPLSNRARWGHLLLLRRMLDNLAANGCSITPHLIHSSDFPPLPHYLPRALSFEDDRRLQQELRRDPHWHAAALLLLRLTGMRIGESLDLSRHCLRSLGPDTWGIHVPLGKLHTERMLPADPDIRQTVSRILSCCPLDTHATGSSSALLLLPRSGTRDTLYEHLRLALVQAARRAGCSSPVTPHRLRHTFASEMVRLGINLPTLMLLLGHKDIRMTLRYVQITQLDLQREFYTARRNAAEPHRIPVLSPPTAPTTTSIPSICDALKATRHLLEMYRRQLNDDKTRRKLTRLDHRLLTVTAEFEKLDNAEK